MRWLKSFNFSPTGPHFLSFSLCTRGEEKQLGKVGIEPKSTLYTRRHSIHLTMAPQAIVVWCKVMGPSREGDSLISLKRWGDEWVCACVCGCVHGYVCGCERGWDEWGRKSCKKEKGGLLWKARFLLIFKRQTDILSLCVCACVRERERERAWEGSWHSDKTRLIATKDITQQFVCVWVNACASVSKCVCNVRVSMW